MNRTSLLVIALVFVLDACCREDFIIPTKDFRETAIDLTSLIGNCSADGAYSTIGATPSGEAGSCWNNNGPRHTAWFKFKATSTTEIYIVLQVGTTEYGTQRKSLANIWDTDGTTELDCDTYANYGVNNDIATLYLTYGDLTPDLYYYFSVDVFDDQSVGTFKLCLDDTD
jgi:hypothetical protein